MIQGGLVFKAHRLVYHSTLGSRGMKKEEKDRIHQWTSLDQSHPADHFKTTLENRTLRLG